MTKETMEKRINEVMSMNGLDVDARAIILEAIINEYKRSSITAEKSDFEQNREKLLEETRKHTVELKKRNEQRNFDAFLEEKMGMLEHIQKDNNMGYAYNRAELERMTVENLLNTYEMYEKHQPEKLEMAKNEYFEAKKAVLSKQKAADKMVNDEMEFVLNANRNSGDDLYKLDRIAQRLGVDTSDLFEIAELRKQKIDTKKEQTPVNSTKENTVDKNEVFEIIPEKIEEQSEIKENDSTKEKNAKTFDELADEMTAEEMNEVLRYYNEPTLTEFEKSSEENLNKFTSEDEKLFKDLEENEVFEIIPETIDEQQPEITEEALGVIANPVEEQPEITDEEALGVIAKPVEEEQPEITDEEALGVIAKPVEEEQPEITDEEALGVIAKPVEEEQPEITNEQTRKKVSLIERAGIMIKNFFTKKSNQNKKAYMITGESMKNKVSPDVEATQNLTDEQIMNVLKVLPDEESINQNSIRK